MWPKNPLCPNMCPKKCVTLGGNTIGRELSVAMNEMMDIVD